MQINDVQKAGQCQHQGQANKGDKAQKMQEYEELVTQAQSLGITDIPAPGRGAIDQLTQLIEQAQNEQGGGVQVGNYGNLFANNTVGLGASGSGGGRTLGIA